LNPIADPFDSEPTFTVAVREEGSTAHEASSGSCPACPTRTRTTSSRNAVICITAVPERISIPFGSAREPVTRSSRTKAALVCAEAAVVICDVAAKNRTAKTAEEKPLTRYTLHLYRTKNNISHVQVL
jgi:hypothetical protein